LICVKDLASRERTMQLSERTSPSMYKRILICTDGSRLAQTAAREGVELAACLGSSVVALL
jgi:hypothetical protein